MTSHHNLPVNDSRHFADTFWFTLFHEIGHILYGDLGFTFDNEAEDDADRYAKNTLILAEPYEKFIKTHKAFDEEAILSFARSINQALGIVYGRLQKDGRIPYEEKVLAKNSEYVMTSRRRQGKIYLHTIDLSLCIIVQVINTYTRRAQ